MSIKFFLLANDGAARVARIKTAHSEFETPVFMPVATLAAFRCLTTNWVKDLGFPIILANTFHLMLRPGKELFERVGGIHQFMNWQGSVLTDSGGFQIFSLPKVLKLNEQGAKFRSFVDGTPHELSPEISMQMQHSIGSDILMALDECVPSTVEHARALAALERTTRWAKRSLEEHTKINQQQERKRALFGIIQGACYEDLRAISAGEITNVTFEGLKFDGYAMGGLAVGEPRPERQRVMAQVAPLMPEDKPRYVMGIGTPIDLFDAVSVGVDMFDCILPLSVAQTGAVYSSYGRLDLNRGVYREQDRPIDTQCSCFTCKNYTRAYLKHLLHSKEFAVRELLGIHNLAFYQKLIVLMRAAIKERRFVELYKHWEPILTAQDIENPPIPTQAKSTKAEAQLQRRTTNGFEIVERNENGENYGVIRHIESGETMHSVRRPEDEARELYLEQTDFIDKIQTPGETYIIWDVGLGAASNVMAFLHAYEALNSEGKIRRNVKVYSFETTLAPLQLAISEPSLFPAISHNAPKSIIKDKFWKGSYGDNSFEWILHLGNFLEKYPKTETPEVILYDPFSFKVDSPLWTYEVFQNLRNYLGDTETQLISYSAATLVRSIFLASGFFVAYGRASGPKKNTTLAYTARKEGITLLDVAWLEKWKRSSAQMPEYLSEQERQEFTQKILEHQQFMHS